MDLNYSHWSDISNDHLEDMVYSTLKKERGLLVELLAQLSILFRRKLYASRGYCSLNEYLMDRFGLSKHQAWQRAAVARIVDEHPKLLDMLEKGETCLSRLAMIASRLTPANSAVLYNAACVMSKRELEAFLPRVANTGEIMPGEDMITLTIKCSADCVDLFDHAAALARTGQSSLTQGEILQIALESYLEKRDPERKAMRAEKRRVAKRQAAVRSLEKLKENLDPRRAHRQAVEIYELGLAQNVTHGEIEDLSLSQDQPKIEEVAVSPASKNIERGSCDPQDQEGERYERVPIPAAVKHQVMLRDVGRCTWVSPEGRRCESRRHLQIDHIKMVCRGGGNDIGNLRTLCSTHNQLEMIKQIGVQTS